MELDELILCFYAKEYKEYDPNGERLDSFEIDGTVVTLHHHSKDGKTFITEYTVWDVMASLFASGNSKQVIQPARRSER
jgi:hypothetical protein